MPLHGQVQQGLHRVRPRLLELCEERGHLAVGRLLYLVQLAPARARDQVLGELGLWEEPG